MNMSLTLILRWKLCYLGLASISMMRCGIYEDVMHEDGLGPNNEILTFEQVENEIIRTKAVLLHRVLLYRTVSWISMLAPNASVITAGSRLTTWTCFETNIFFFSMVLEKVSLKQSREHWLRIPYGVERRIRVELKSVKIIMIYNLCFHFNSNNLFRFLYLFD